MTKAIEKSRFGWLLSSESRVPRRLCDQELFSSQSFVVVPSLGSLVPGWLLIVPRRPMVSFRELNEKERREVEGLLGATANLLRAFDGQVFAFEHGSATRGSSMGCGVDHAHLHVIPLNFDLVEWAMLQPDDGVHWSYFPEFLLTDLPTTGEYISVWEVSNRRGALAKVSKPVSQWMRRAIAGKLGMDGHWDYRKNPQEENIRATVETIRRMTSLTR